MRLGDIATFVNGYAFKPDEYSDEGKPIIRIQDLTGNAYQTNKFSGRLDKKYLVSTGDILISWSASIDAYEWSGEQAWLNQHIFKVVFDKVEVDKYFFLYQIKYILRNAMQLAHGATMRHLTKRVFNGFEFSLPPIDCQMQQAKVLHLVDRLIYEQRRRLCLADNLVKSRFVEMFGDPVGGKSRFVRVPIGRLARVSSGATPSRKHPDYYSGTIPWVKTGEVAAGDVYVTEEHITQEAIENTACNLLSAGTVLIAMYGQGDTRGKASMLKIEAATNQACAALEFDERVNPQFAIAHLHFCYKDLRGLSRGGNQKNLNLQIIKAYELIVPPIELQEEFAAFVAQVDKSGFAVRRSIEQLELLKAKLMQDYFG